MNVFSLQQLHNVNARVAAPDQNRFVARVNSSSSVSDSSHVLFSKKKKTFNFIARHKALMTSFTLASYKINILLP